MTILQGEVTKVESKVEFRDEMDVGIDEIRDLLTDEEVSNIIDVENETRLAEDEEPISALGEVPESVILDYVHTEWSTMDMITKVLEHYDTKYVHLFDGYVHTIVEIFDDQL